MATVLANRRDNNPQYDEQTGFPIITLEQLITLQQPQNRQEYMGHEGHVKTYKHRNVLLNIKDETMLSVSAFKKLALLYPETFKLPAALDVPVYKPSYEKSIRFYIKNVYEVFQRICKNKLKIDGEADELIPWLSLFLVYGDYFTSYLEQYNERLDTSVTIDDNIKNEDFKLTPSSKINNVDAYDIRATCHILLISMLKTFHKNRDISNCQKAQYLSNRISTVYASMNAKQGELLITPGFLDKYAQCLNVMPNLKKTLFYFTYENQEKYPEIGTALTLMHASATMGIVAMHQFLTGEPVTFAHVNKLVLADAKRFISAIKQLRNELKVLWPFYRFVKPFDTTLEVANFKNLAVAAISWKTKFSDPTFAQVQLGNIPGVPQSIERDAKIPLHRPHENRHYKAQH